MGFDKKYIKGFQEGRAAGMRIAYEDIKKGGIKELERDLKFREKSKVDTNLSLKEIENASEAMRGFINEGHILVWLSVLHDEFDFGAKRLDRACNRFEEIYSQIVDGYAGWADYIDVLSEKMKNQLSSDFLQQDGNWTKEEGK